MIKLKDWLSQPAGCNFVVYLLLASGFVFKLLGLPFGDEVILGTASVAFARIAQGQGVVHGERIISAAALLGTGVAGSYVDARTGGLLTLAALAVLLHLVQSRQPAIPIITAVSHPPRKAKKSYMPRLGAGSPTTPSSGDSVRSSNSALPPKSSRSPRKIYKKTESNRTSRRRRSRRDKA